MKKTLSLVLTLAMLVSMLAGCSSDSSSASTSSSTATTSTESSSTTTAADTTEAVDLSVEPDGIVAGSTANMYLTIDAVAQQLPGQFLGGRAIYAFVYDTLFWSPSGSWDDLEGLLVSDYTVSDDGLTWVLNLHEGINFQNGNPLTADSVISTFDYFTSNNIATNLSGVASYEATGDYQVTLTLYAPCPEMMYNLANQHLGIFDTSLYDQYGTSVEAAYMVGSGPYYISDFASGDYITYTADTDHWNPDRQAHIETVTCKIILDANTQVTALTSGEMDFGRLSDYSSYETLLLNDEIAFATADISGAVWINASGSMCEYLTNENVRKALSLLVDSEELTLASTGGYGSFPSNAFSDALDYEHSREYDPEAGLALLAAEGIDPSDLVLTALSDTAKSGLFSNMQAQYSEYGITLNFTVQDNPAVMSAAMAGEWDFWSEGGGMGTAPYYSSPANNLFLSSSATCVMQVASISDEVDALLNSAFTSLTIDEEYALLSNLMELFDTNYAYAASVGGPIWYAYNTRIQNAVIDTESGGWYVWDAWMS